MITYVEGDLFTSPAQVLVNTVNTVGVMGKGIAKEFKYIYPEMFEVYQRYCEQGELTVGKLLLYRTAHKWVLNFPTKRHWRQRSRIDDIEAGLRTFAARYAEFRLLSVAFPQLGCGNGELDWETQVRPLMERYLGSLPIDIFVHIYSGRALLPEHRDRQEMKAWLRSEPRSLAFSEFWEDLIGILEHSAAANWRLLPSNNAELSAIRYQSNQRTVDVFQEDLLDLWQRFRSFGFLSEADVPTECGEMAVSLLELFQELPYVEAATFATLASARENNLSKTTELLGVDESRGIRLVPPIGESEALLGIGLPLPVTSGA